jgi:hypothetical protein
MAKSKEIAVVRSKSALFLDEKYTGPEPVWDTARALEFDDDTFDHFLRRSLNYSNYYFSQATLKKEVVAYAIKNDLLAEKELIKYQQSKDAETPMTVCGLVRASNRGMPLKQRHKDYILKQILKIVRSAPEPTRIAKVDLDLVRPPSIQERLAEKMSEIMGELEGVYDSVVKNTATDFKAYDFLILNKVPQNQLGKYELLFDSKKEELELAQSKKDEQLAEAYKHYKAADFKRLFAFIADFKQAVEQYRGVKQATKKARIKKAPTKEKLVAKLKYKKDDKALKLVSINPAEIIGASALWVYNIKTRKLGCYLADQIAGPLSIKGSAIIGYDTAKSVSKTLRKPEEKLVEFARASKVQLRKFLQDVKATETALNGRINQDIILLKVT